MQKVKTFQELQAEQKTPEILFWVGCLGQLDERAIKITKAFCEILQKANVDFGVLGKEESCTGDPARRIGNEMLFQMMAMKNIQTLNQYGVKKIVTTCPHCFNTLKNEYPELGGHYEVVHHTTFLNQLIDEGKLVLSKDIKHEEMTYHDPCYLSRANGIVEAPREVIQKLKIDLKELKGCKKNSLCCGAGGGQMFKEEEKGTKRINQERIEQIQQSQTKTVVSACPFCNVMLIDANKGLEEDKQVNIIDLAELVNKYI